MKETIERIFKQYRKHKYYTLFMSDYNINVTSKIDEVGGGRSNQTSNPTADTAIKLADKKQEALEFVERVEKAVEQLPDIERDLIKYRYMTRDYNYISDYTIYEVKIPMSPNTYRKIRERASEKLYNMLVDKLITKE